MITNGLDRLLANPEGLEGRRYGLVSHSAARSADLQPIHLALLRSGAPPPLALFGPEHGFYGEEQDMIPSPDGVDPWTGIPTVSLYGDSAGSLRPDPATMAGLDLLVIDLQDIGCRYYTYAATAIWSAEAALAAGIEVWILDRPNPLGGLQVEGNLRAAGLESFVGAFTMPVRHGLTLGEMVRLEAKRGGWSSGIRIWEVEWWEREMLWSQLGRPWVAPSPNIPSQETAFLYPGLCLVEGTEISEGRGTTRPFQLVGAPGIDSVDLADAMQARGLPGVRFLPAVFRPQFHKHEGELCGGVEIRVTDYSALRPYRCGVELLAVMHQVAPEAFAWRRQAYEFVGDRPAIDLLSGDSALRLALEAGDEPTAWIESWATDEETFRRESADVLLYRQSD
jgi:uncharacterized protein YbbC (DUF1343 family)